MSVISLHVLFFSIRALKGAKGENVEISAPIGIYVTTDDGRTLGSITQPLMFKVNFITKNVEHLGPYSALG